MVTTVIRSAAMRLRVMFMTVAPYASRSAVITTSMTLIPMNGTMTPPTP